VASLPSTRNLRIRLTALDGNTNKWWLVDSLVVFQALQLPNPTPRSVSHHTAGRYQTPVPDSGGKQPPFRAKPPAKPVQTLDEQKAARLIIHRENPLTLRHLSRTASEVSRHRVKSTGRASLPAKIHSSENSPRLRVRRHGIVFTV
jgi:hypothetical protein